MSTQDLPNTIFACFKLGSLRGGHYRVLENGDVAIPVEETDTPNYFLSKDYASYLHELCKGEFSLNQSIFIELFSEKDNAFLEDRILAKIKCGELQVGYYIIDVETHIGTITSNPNEANAYLDESSHHQASFVCRQISLPIFVYMHLKKIQ